MEQTAETDYGYDADGNQTTVKGPSVTVWDPNANKGQGGMVTEQPTTTTEYDADGRPVLVTDPEGHKTAYEYDSAGNLTLTTYDDGSFVKDQYDAFGHKTAESQQALAGTPDSTLVWTTYKYDVNGNLTEVDQPQVPNPTNPGQMVTPITQYTYDQQGHELTQTDANNHTTSFTYDAFGNQLTRTLPGEEVSKQFYDTYGRLDHSLDFDGNQTQYHYDDLNRVTEIDYTPAGASSPDETVSYSYDGLGQKTLAVDQTYTMGQFAATVTTKYAYDAQGNLTSTETIQQQQGTTLSHDTVNHVYDPATGLLIQTNTSDGALNESYA